MNEFNFISKYLSKLAKKNTSSKNLNDDVFFDKRSGLVVSVDTYNEGVHFVNFSNPELVIKKIVRSSISDLICKGVKPKYYFLSASGNNKMFNKKKIKKLIRSLNSEQKKFNILISGGDTCSSKTNSFTMISVGFSNKIIERNKVKINDDIYVTGNLGDSFIGLNILKKSYDLRKNLKKYFLRKYYCPDIPYNYLEIIKNFAHSSIDISDGLFDDIKKLINKQNLGFNIYLDKLPISRQLKIFLRDKNKNKLDQIYHGDDYQIIFTAHKKFRNVIIKKSKKMNQKVTIIGEISSKKGEKNLLVGQKILKLSKFKGYLHSF